jgi:hypothetical protein
VPTGRNPHDLPLTRRIDTVSCSIRTQDHLHGRPVGPGVAEVVHVVHPVALPDPGEGRDEIRTSVATAGEVAESLLAVGSRRCRRCRRPGRRTWCEGRLPLHIEPPAGAVRAAGHPCPRRGRWGAATGCPTGTRPLVATLRAPARQRENASQRPSLELRLKGSSRGISVRAEATRYHLRSALSCREGAGLGVAGTAALQLVPAGVAATDCAPADQGEQTSWRIPLLDRTRLAYPDGS